MNCSKIPEGKRHVEEPIICHFYVPVSGGVTTCADTVSVIVKPLPAQGVMGSLGIESRLINMVHPKYL